jgi:hypothetical protein
VGCDKWGRANATAANGCCPRTLPTPQLVWSDGGEQCFLLRFSPVRPMPCDTYVVPGRAHRQRHLNHQREREKNKTNKEEKEKEQNKRG